MSIRTPKTQKLGEPAPSRLRLVERVVSTMDRTLYQLPADAQQELVDQVQTLARQAEGRAIMKRMPRFSADMANRLLQRIMEEYPQMARTLEDKQRQEAAKYLRDTADLVTNGDLTDLATIQRLAGQEAAAAAFFAAWADHYERLNPTPQPAND